MSNEVEVLPPTKSWDKERGYRINPTGNPLDLEDTTPSTVCISTDVMKYKIENRIRERERKLFVLLVHAVWDELGKKQKHKVKIEDIKRVFQAVGNVKDYNDWLWEYLENLSDIKVTYRDEKLRGVMHLFSEAWLDDEKEHINFALPPTLAEALLSAEHFARLDTYFIVGLKGKYSVALYQFLEGKIEMNKFKHHKTPDPEKRFIKVTLEELRTVLGVKDGEYVLWNDFRRFVLTPAVKEINTNPLHSTFTIRTETVTGSRKKIIAVKFFLAKTQERLDRETEINIAKRQREPNFLDRTLDQYSQAILMPEVHEIVSKYALGHDAITLYQQWRKKAAESKQYQNKGSFVNYCKKTGVHKDRNKGLFGSLLDKFSGKE
jgi:hypothetical protein